MLNAVATQPNINDLNFRREMNAQTNVIVDAISKANLPVDSIGFTQLQQKLHEWEDSYRVFTNMGNLSADKKQLMFNLVNPIFDTMLMYSRKRTRDKHTDVSAGFITRLFLLK